MGVRTAIVPRGAVAVGELNREPAAHQGLEALVHSGEGDAGHPLSDAEEDLVGSRVNVCPGEIPIDRSSLLREALSTDLKGTTETLFVGLSVHGHTLSAPVNKCQANEIERRIQWFKFAGEGGTVALVINLASNGELRSPLRTQEAPVTESCRRKVAEGR